MNRFDHLFLTTVAFLIVWFILRHVLPAEFSLWLLLVAWVGGMFPDFDLDWQPILGHRSVVTHSMFAPTLLIAAFTFLLRMSGWWIPVDRYFAVVFLLACGWHLLLDLLPSTSSILRQFRKNPRNVGEYIAHGIAAVPGSITRIPAEWKRAWLISNALALFAVSTLVWVWLPV